MFRRLFKTLFRVRALTLLFVLAGLSSRSLWKVLHQRSVNEAEAIAALSSEEHSVVSIPLAGPISDRDSEVSGLAWHGDYLILLPQYPGRLDNRIFALEKSDVVAFLDGRTTEPLTPLPIAWNAPDFAGQIDGFEGFEAIAFKGNQAFVTIEAETAAGATGYVVTGTLSADLGELTIDPTVRVESAALSTSPNKADEAIFIADEQIVSLYEVHGAQIVSNPEAHRFDLTLSPLSSVPFPNVEYRLTDATALDENNRFWAINYFYPGDTDLLPERDPLAIRYGRGTTHRQQAVVERLVEFVYDERGIRLTSTAPIQLVLGESGRNWEGIARLDDDGFLLVTDKFPETILGFVSTTEAAFSDLEETPVPQKL